MSCDKKRKKSNICASILLNVSNLLHKAIECTACWHFYLFSLTRLINSFNIGTCKLAGIKCTHPLLSYRICQQMFPFYKIFHGLLFQNYKHRPLVSLLVPQCTLTIIQEPSKAYLKKIQNNLFHSDGCSQAC